MYPEETTDLCFAGLRRTNNTNKIRSQENVFGLRIIRINEVWINEVWLYLNKICSVEKPKHFYIV